MSLTSSAYLKPLLHAAKYPSSPVFGLLIGVKTKGSRSWLITDSVPLFHTHILAPMLELAFIQVEEYCRCLGLREHRRFRILGCYVANERVGDVELNVMTRRVATRINTVSGGKAVVLLIDNTKIAKPVNVFKTFVGTERNWRALPDAEEYSPPKKAFLDLAALIRKDQEKELYDFEDHLINPARDYFNVGFLPQADEDLALISSAQIVVEDDEEVEQKFVDSESEDDSSQTAAATNSARGSTSSTGASGITKPKPEVLGTGDDID